MRRSLVPVALASTITLAAAAPNQEPSPGSPVASLVETERAFSRLSVAEGTRTAFLAYFAADGVSFSPAPVIARESLSKLPAAPPTVVLEWVPVTADVARAGDLGYTTGPWVRTERKKDGKPLAYGWYFTVWKKEVDGSWKVAADIGTTTPAHSLPSAAAFRPAIGGGSIPAVAAGARACDAPDIATAEKKFSELASAAALDAYLACGAEGLRLHRDGAEPLVGAAAIQSYFGEKPLRTSSTSIKTDASKSGDLGYSYGSFVAPPAAAWTSAKDGGFYLRVWKRLDGDWRIVADIANR